MSTRSRSPFVPTRRHFVQGLAAGGSLAAMGIWPRASQSLEPARRIDALTGTDFNLTIGETAVNYTGRARTAITMNGTLPAPVLRWREGTTVNLSVTNALPVGSMHGDTTSIHWHGIVLPADMDGVPGMSFDGIRRGETFRYRFDVKQAGTYWYHSHSGFQEQAGLYGALVIDPLQPEPFTYQRDYVVLLSDWTDLTGEQLFARLKKMAAYDNHHQPTLADFFHDARRDGFKATAEERAMWGAMRMSRTDIADVNGNTYTYLMNGTTSLGNWTGLFAAGEKLRLRFINGSSMTYFDVRIPGLKMTVVAADGQYVHPVTVEEFRIAAAETFDVIVEPTGQDAFTIFAQDSARTGFVRGTLASRAGLTAPVPPLDARPILTMADMGMMHGVHHMDMDMDMEGMPKHPPSEQHNALVDNQARMPTARLDDPGNGLRDNGRTVLSYAMLKSLTDADGREPMRELELHLTGHMEKFAWSFDGIKFSGAAPLHLNYGERLRIVLVNDTMMAHPIHLHGMWSDVEDEHGAFMVRKHTVDMPPGSRRSYRVSADAPGSWAYHCHMLYHMEAGMMRHVMVAES
ncbi:MAG: copper resistance system multicopper oxidase [Pseudomonadota bacterium]